MAGVTIQQYDRFVQNCGIDADKVGTLKVAGIGVAVQLYIIATTDNRLDNRDVGFLSGQSGRSFRAHIARRKASGKVCCSCSWLSLGKGQVLLNEDLLQGCIS